jgi:2-polyprenyl-3-methyl-5-hydroxy-6-metoxy-1,4-benzoquinol methylase
MKCPICNSSKKPKKIQANHVGYVKGTNFDIFKCSNCDSHFIDMSKLNPSLYDKIYSQENVTGYKEYQKYASAIKTKKNPLKYLSRQSEIYYPIFLYLKNQKNLDVLEVGCGYGYTAYGVFKSGQKITAIDISKKAIDFAKKNFGDFYINSSLENFKTDKKFDLIYSTEVIEHVPDPIGFVKKLKKHLKPGGRILITTPNKNYSDCVRSNVIWNSDLPPVHTFWLTQKGAELLASQVSMKISFFNYKNYPSKGINAYFEYKALQTNKNQLVELAKNPQQFLHIQKQI